VNHTQVIVSNNHPRDVINKYMKNIPYSVKNK